jgi:hypothetical protein
MRAIRPICAAGMCLAALLLMGKRQAPPEDDPPPPPENTMEKELLRPRHEASVTVDTLLGSMPPLDGYDEKVSTNGTVRLESGDGVVIVIDTLSADSVEEGGYNPETVRAIVAKQFEPRVVKDPELPGNDVALRFRGYGALDESSVAFVLDMVDTPSRGPGMILIFGPNSQRDSFPAMTEQIVAMLIAP